MLYLRTLACRLLKCRKILDILYDVSMKRKGIQCTMFDHKFRYDSSRFGILLTITVRPFRMGKSVYFGKRVLCKS